MKGQIVHKLTKALKAGLKAIISYIQHPGQIACILARKVTENKKKKK